LLSDQGAVWSFGTNEFGQLGDGTNANYIPDKDASEFTPVSVKVIPPAKIIAVDSILHY
jgi:alpha-tubulin suppressor-like RCC1 family protein